MFFQIFDLTGKAVNETIIPEIETRVNQTTIEYKYTNDETWKLLVDFSSLLVTNEEVFEVTINEMGETILIYGEEEINIGKRDIISVTNLTYDEVGGELLAHYTDGSKETIGKITIPSAIHGNDGVGIQDVMLTQDGHLKVLLTDDSSIDIGNIIGEKGNAGQDGLGIIDIKVDASGDCYITYSDYTKVNIGPIVGEDGRDGTNGEKGETAYELYVKYHPSYTKTEKDWVDDLVLGKLSSIDTYDILTKEDFIYALTQEDIVSIKLQADIALSDLITIVKEKDINLNGYQIDGNIHISSNEDINISIINGWIKGDVSVDLPNSLFRLNVDIDGAFFINQICDVLDIEGLVTQGVFIKTQGDYHLQG